MGIYPVDCIECNKPFLWFSGNPLQICEECSTPTKSTKEYNDRWTKELVNPPFTEKKENNK